MIYEDPCEIVLDDVFLRLRDFLPGAEVMLKIEGLNPAGSIKLKTAVSLVQDLEECARLRAGSRIIESSSGNLGKALSVVCATKGYRLTIVTDPNAARASIHMMEALGTDVVVVRERDPNGGFLGTRIDYILAELARDGDLVWPNQYANQANASAHYERTARSIHTEIPQADAIVIGVGTSGTLMGCLSYYLKHSPGTRIIAVDAAGSVLFGGPSGPRHIPGIGASRVTELLTDDGDFEKVLVPEAEAVAMCWQLARERGLLVGGSTGSVLAAVRTLAATFSPGDTVVAVSADLGEQYLESVYERSWVSRHFGGHAAIGG